MVQPSGIDLAIARLEAALDRACGAAVVLATIRTDAADIVDDVRNAHAQVRGIMNEIRGAVEELAQLRNERVSIGALGFVAASEAIEALPRPLRPAG